MAVLFQFLSKVNAKRARRWWIDQKRQLRSVFEFQTGSFRKQGCCFGRLNLFLLIWSSLFCILLHTLTKKNYSCSWFGKWSTPTPAAVKQICHIQATPNCSGLRFKLFWKLLFKLSHSSHNKNFKFIVYFMVATDFFLVINLYKSLKRC